MQVIRKVNAPAMNAKMRGECDAALERAEHCRALKRRKEHEARMAEAGHQPHELVNLHLEDGSGADKRKAALSTRDRVALEMCDICTYPVYL